MSCVRMIRQTMSGEPFIKRFLPRSLLGRSLMIIVTPLVLLQIVAGLIFYESHWDKVTLRLARGFAGDIAAVIDFMRDYPGIENQAWISDVAADTMGLTISKRRNEILPNVAPVPTGIMEKMLVRAVEEGVRKPFSFDTATLDRHVIVTVQLSDGILEVIAPRKRLTSSTTYIFVLWMVGISLILFSVATIFMRNQVKPIRRLAGAADDFGKGRDAPRFKPEGAKEVRQAATAFIAMRERIQRQITRRTEMLAGVSHDLRTPLTRMKLQLEMLGDTAGTAELKSDVSEMEHMLEGYLAFARGEGEEAPTPTDLCALLGEVTEQARRNGGAIDLHTEGDIVVALRPAAFRRSLTNLINNAMRYADHVSVRAGQRGDAVEIMVDDDGPGIPADDREDVFKPFFRLEGSRNQETGGVGLGLTIARDVVHGHGGDLALDEAPGGGLRACIRLPL
jgi:two-component system osmolarity sensor histidine kinase EnvZ